MVLGKLKKLLLIITRRCNLRCSYCEVFKSNNDMDLTTLERSVSLISSLATNKKYKPVISLTFFGGEPLLRFDLIKKAVLKLKKFDNIHFFIFTNGTLLDKIDLNFILKHRIKLFISIDGDYETQIVYRKDITRKFYNYFINKILSKLKSMGIDYCAEMTISPLTAKDLSKNFFYLVNLGFKEINIVPTISTLTKNDCFSSFRWDKNSLLKFEIELTKVNEMFCKFLKSGKNIKLRNLELRKKEIKENVDLMEIWDQSIGIDIDGDFCIGDTCLLLPLNLKSLVSLSNIWEIKNLDLFFKKYINNKKNFKQWRNSIIHRCSNPAMAILDKAMDRLNKMLLKEKIFLKEEF